MDSIVGVMKRVAEHEVQRIQTTELGVVTAVFPHGEESDSENYHCSVKLKQHRLADGQPLELRNVPVVTPYIGLVCIPNVGDLVLLNFIGGDINAPIITGRLYNDEDRPPINKKNEFLLQHTIKEGGSIKLDEEGKVLITSKDEKNVITVENEKISLVNEKYSLIIDVSGEKITISSDKDIELNAQQGKLSLNAKEIEITASADLTLNAQKNIEIKADSQFTIEGTSATRLKSSKEIEIQSNGSVKLNALQNIDLKATSQCTVEGMVGATLKNAAAQVALNGPTVNINNGALEII